jgi:hypothetical protein
MSANQSSNPITYICTACAGTTTGCTHTKDPSLSFHPEKCPGDGLQAVWRIKEEQCKFQRDWAGQCTKLAEPGEDYCKEHLETKCCVCGEQATHSCDYTGQFVCGYPLCDNCTDVTMKNTDPLTLTVRHHFPAASTELVEPTIQQIEEVLFHESNETTNQAATD